MCSDFFKCYAGGFFVVNNGAVNVENGKIRVPQDIAMVTSVICVFITRGIQQVLAGRKPKCLLSVEQLHDYGIQAFW